MIDSATAAKTGGLLNEEANARVASIAQRAPLDARPFAVAGALAQLKGDTVRARELYLAARLRNPRATAVRLLLADLELRTGRIEQGLSNLVAIVNLSGGMAAPVVPALAEFARTPGAIPRMRTALAQNPGLASAVMDQLATDPSNAPLLFALEPALTSSGAGLSPWQQRLIDTTAAAGKVAMAQQYWARFNRTELGTGNSVYNPGFEKRSASPPFNWAFASGPAGIAELLPQGGLSIVHFGREPALFARQLLTLEAGAYQMQSRFTGRVEPGRLEWRLQCVRGGPQTVVPAVAGGASFRIEANCPAAWLELYGNPSESGSRLDAVLYQVALRKIG